MSDIFFRFPLRALAVFDSPLNRLDNLVGYCVHDVGTKQQNVAVTATMKPDERLRHIWDTGRKWLNVDWTGSTAHSQCKREHDEVVAKCGTGSQATVSIRADWLWNCLSELRRQEREKPLNYREFSVLCAILSKLGDKDLESCTWQEIQRRALGYTTEAQMKERLPYRTDGAKPLTRQQIRSTLNDLERCGFFARYAVGNGEKCFLTYFSFKMPKQELKAKAVAAFTKRRRRGPIRRTQADKDEASRLWANRHKLP